MGSRISLKALTLLSEGELQRFSKQLTYCSAAPDVPDIQSPKDTEMTWLSEVSVLVQIAVAEMRALIFELRPESLETEGLVAALEKQAASLRDRHEIGVEATLCDDRRPPYSVGQK